MPKDVTDLNQSALCAPLATERNARISEYKRRKPRLLQKRVSLDESKSYLDAGWTEKRLLSTGKVIVEKLKPHDEVLENRLWSALYHLGFEELNQGRQFCISTTSDGSSVAKQIDVYGKIDDVVVIAECKSNSKKQARSLQKDIGEFASLQRPIANSLRKHYGPARKLKIVWLLATRGIIWSTPDRKRASEQNIHILEERELRYYEEIAKSVGPAARYQFLAEFLDDQKIPAFANQSVPAIRSKLGGAWAYYFLVSPTRLLPISFVNHRALRDPKGAPAYQRVLKRSRLREIGSYLDSGGFFPNCILINFQTDPRFDKQTIDEEKQITFGQLYLPDTFKSAYIIDGQHRLYGYTEKGKISSKDVVPVLAFQKISHAQEAQLFATINSKQQKVSPGLLDELAGELKIDSDDFDERCGAIASRALDMMATENGNPFEDRIKTADLADSDTVCLTISEIKKAILSSKLIGSKSRNDVEIPGPLSRSTTNGTLDALCDGLTEYFRFIEEADQERWELGRPGRLCSNVSVQGHIRLMQALFDYLRQDTGQEATNLDATEAVEQIKRYLQPVINFIENATDEEFNRRFKTPFGSGGPPRYFAQLCRLVQTTFPDFQPAGLSEIMKEESTESEKRADAVVRSLQERVHAFVVAQLKAVYGSDLNQYFNQGIPQTKIKLSANEKMYEDKAASRPPETYLDLTDLKEIAEHKQNWDHFKDTLSIQMTGDPKGQARYLKWMDRLNELRRISAHPYSRSYRDNDIEFLEDLDERLRARNV